MQYRTRKSVSIRNLIVAGLMASFMLLVSACEWGPTTLAPTISGAEVDLAGPEWLVVNYWAEWCGPCRHEIPELNELDESVLATHGEAADALQTAAVPAAPDIAVNVLGVNYDGLVDQKLIDVSERMGITFAVLAGDPRERWGQPLPSVLPSTYLIAPGGEFVETLVGPQTRAGILSRIEALAGGRD